MHAEVIIVGAGPAGSWLAFILARRGIDVMLLEKEDWPRYKACGGALSAKTVDLLKKRGIVIPEKIIENSVQDFTFRFGFDRSFPVRYKGPDIKLVNRNKFDDFLLNLALEEGAIFKARERAMNVEIQTDKVIIETENNSYTARIVVGADGANSKIRQKLNLSVEGLLQDKGIAVELELEKREDINFDLPGLLVDFNFIPSGYCWVFPKREQYSIGLGTFAENKINLKQLLFDYLEKLGISKPGAELFYRGHPIPVCGKRASELKIAGRRYMLLGDAAFLSDPLVGEGIYYACLSAELAGDVILKHLNTSGCDLSDYGKVIAHEVYPNLQMAGKVANWFYGHLKIVESILDLKPGLINNFLDVIQGRYTYNELLSYIPAPMGNFIK